MDTVDLLRVAQVPIQAVIEYMKAMKRGAPGAARFPGSESAADAPEPALCTDCRLCQYDALVEYG